MTRRSLAMKTLIALLSIGASLAADAQNLKQQAAGNLMLDSTGHVNTSDGEIIPTNEWKRAR
ncbi:hypothetical protein CJU94_30815 [Paraburkholderia aromaticivorans]|uniref:Uncharacterized protein n=2 Tax=Paraburkholderia aromaticivorans TaxID=2026199 RepID=A0A248VUB0_9BURK|nr:hypothetical protein CJU94_30815 [Paraburkholderia aromaticivorans]